MSEAHPKPAKHLRLEESYSFSNPIIDYIQHAAEYGLYEIRGLGAKRKVPTFDDLVFLTASLSRYPLEGYRETLRDRRRCWEPVLPRSQSN